MIFIMSFFHTLHILYVMYEKITLLKHLSIIFCVLIYI